MKPLGQKATLELSNVLQAMPQTKCKNCKREFYFEPHLQQHLESRAGLTCHQRLTLEKGNGNVLLSVTLGDGIANDEQEQRAKKQKFKANLLGSYSNANMLRIKVEYGLSEKVYNDLISTLRDPRWNSAEITALNKDVMYNEIDRTLAPIMNTEGMVQKFVTIGGHKYNYYVVKNLPFEAALMLTNSRMRGSINYESETLYIDGHDGDEDYRVYNEPWTGKFWREQEDQIQEKFGDDVKYVATIVHIDGTVVVGFGKGSQKTYVTASITLGNFTSAARAAKVQESGNRIPVLYLPTLVKDAKNTAANFRNERLLNQICLESLFEGFLCNDGYGSVYEVCDANGRCQRVCPGLFVINQDLAELYKRFLMVSGTCPCCMCPKESLANCEVLFPARKSCADVLSIWNATTKKTQRKIVMRAEGLKDLPFWGWGLKRVNVYSLHGYDELHVIDKTVTGDDLFMRCLTGALMGLVLGDVDGDNEPQGLVRAQIVVHLQARDQAIQKCPYFQFADSSHHTKYFYNGIRLGDDSDAKWPLGSTIFMEGNITSFFQSHTFIFTHPFTPGPGPAYSYPLFFFTLTLSQASPHSPLFLKLVRPSIFAHYRSCFLFIPSMGSRPVVQNSNSLPFQRPATSARV